MSLVKFAKAAAVRPLSLTCAAGDSFLTRAFLDASPASLLLCSGLAQKYAACTKVAFQFYPMSSKCKQIVHAHNTVVSMRLLNRRRATQQPSDSASPHSDVSNAFDDHVMFRSFFNYHL
jgi:hypothetical protein